MLQPPRKGEKWNEKLWTKRNTFNNNNLQTPPTTRVFATNFAFGCKYASFERHFVKKIQHLFTFHATG